MRKVDKAKIKRILVITLSNIGDIILTTPVVESLLRNFQEAELDVMVGPSGEELFRKHKSIKNVVIYNKKISTLDKFKLFLSLRKNHYDLVVDLRNTILPLVLGAKFITNPLRHGKKKRIHKKEVHLSRLDEIGIDIQEAAFYIPVDDTDKEYVDELLKALKDRPFITVSPGAKSHVKRWPIKSFAKLCDRIQKELDYEIVLIGDKNDRIVTERIMFYMETLAFNFIEKTNISQLATLIGRSKLLITNDSAPLHIASAEDIPTLAFFGPTDWKKYGPLAKTKNKVLKKDLKCAPCEVAQCINFSNKYECLKTISPEEAFEVVKGLLQDENTFNENR